jgi:hypothetical protein
MRPLIVFRECTLDRGYPGSLLLEGESAEGHRAIWQAPRAKKGRGNLRDDAIKYVERAPRVKAEAVCTILEAMGKTGVSLETFADHSIVDQLVRDRFIEQLYRKR